MRRTSGWLRWGFCSIRGALTACRRRVGALDGAIPPVWWWRGRCLRWRGAQNADHLEQSTPNSPIFTEVVCVLGSSRGDGLLAHVVGRLAGVVATRQPHCAFAR